MELGLRDFVEVSYADDSGQDHLGIMEINELFEDSQVTVERHSHCAHKLPPALFLQELYLCLQHFYSFGSQQFVYLDTHFTAFHSTNCLGCNINISSYVAAVGSAP